MKKFLSLCFILLTLNSFVMAQKGFDVKKEIVINVPAEYLWEMVGPGFVEVYKWASNVDHAAGKGTSEFEGAVCDERFCELNVKGFSEISEKLTQYNQDNMTLAYVVKSGMPKFVSKAENLWTVIPIDGNHSKLVMNANFELQGFMGFMMKGLMKKKMNSTLDVILNDAKVYAETGNTSDSKAKRIAVLAKKQEKRKAG